MERSFTPEQVVNDTRFLGFLQARVAVRVLSFEDSHKLCESVHVAVMTVLNGGVVWYQTDVTIGDSYISDGRGSLCYETGDVGKNLKPLFDYWQGKTDYPWWQKLVCPEEYAGFRVTERYTKVTPVEVINPVLLVPFGIACQRLISYHEFLKSASERDHAAFQRRTTACGHLRRRFSAFVVNVHHQSIAASAVTV